MKTNNSRVPCDMVKRLNSGGHGTKRVDVFVDLVMLIALVIIANFHMSYAAAAAIIKEPSVCTTKACNETAFQLSNNIDQNVAPCDNFYRFACGKFLLNTKIPDNQYVVNTYSKIEEHVYQQLTIFLLERSEPDEIEPFRIAKKFFRACFNEYEIENAGVKPLQAILSDLGGWPLLEGGNWVDSNYGWTNTVNKFLDNGYNPKYFLDFQIDKDLKNSTNRVIVLRKPQFGFSESQILLRLRDSSVKSYYNSMINIANLLSNHTTVNYSEVKEMLDLELDLAEIFTYEENESHNMSTIYNAMTIDSIIGKWPNIPWVEYLKIMLSPNVILDNNELIIVPDPNYISRLEYIIKNTPVRRQMNYALWTVVRESANYLNKNIVRAWSVYDYATTAEVNNQRWKMCVMSVEKHLPIILGAMYIQKTFNRRDKKDVVAMAQNIKNQFESTLENNQWMDNKTRMSAIAKIKQMNNLIAYSEKLLDNQVLIRAYSGLNIDGSCYLYAMLNISSFLRNGMIQQFRLPFHKNTWIRVTSVNTAYWPKTNAVNVPAAIIQGMFYNIDRPKYMNYGAIGWLIGHETTHGFDAEGRQFDEYGNIRDWWSKKAEKNFINRSRCLVQQYDNYRVEELGMNLNGWKSLDENIADIGGIKMAYHAYNKWVSDNDVVEHSLHDLPYTSKQMFWISAATIKCSAIRSEYMKSFHLTNGVTPPEFRIIGSFSNIPEFSNDFNCKLGSRMNPVEKCDVW